MTNTTPDKKSVILKGIGFSAVFTFLFFLATQKVYHLPFSYGDDHRILAMLHPEKASGLYKTWFYGHSPDLKNTLYRDFKVGRFRPLPWCYDKLLCLLFNDNIHLFRLSSLVMLFLSSFFLWGIFNFFNVDLLSLLVVLAIYVFGKNNETWWTLNPAPQYIGELFLLAGIYFWLLYRKKAIKGFYIFPALLFLFAGLSKESFIFCVPVILLTDYFFFNPSGRLFAEEYLLSLIASLLPFLCLLAIVVHSKRIYSYPYEESALSIAAYNIYEFVRGAVFFLAPIILLAIGRKFMGNIFLLKVLFVFAIWGIIQIILLKGIKLDMQHHYLIPWLIYPLILTAVAFSEIRKISGKWYAVIFILYSMAALLFIKNTYINSCSYSASLQAYYTMIDAIEKDTAAPEIVYLSNDACEKDWIKGTKLIMDNKNIKKELYFSSTASFIPSWEMDYANHSWQNTYRHIPLDSVFHPDGKWIILIETPAKNGIINDSISFYKRHDSAFVKINGKERYIPGEYYYFSVPYPDYSVGDLLKGHFKAENRQGFYAIKLNTEISNHFDLTKKQIPEKQKG